MAGSPIFRRITLTEVKKTSNKRGSLLRELAGLEKEEKDIIKNHHDPSYSNWRSSFLIEDGMSTKGFMQATFPAAGDTDFDSIDSTVDIEQFPDMTSNRDPAGPDGGNWPVQGVEILSSGSGSGDSGGFDIGTDYLAVNNAGGPTYNNINLEPIDCTQLDEIVVTGIRGNGSNGGATPTEEYSSLEIIWQSPETLGESGYPTWANMYNDASLNQVPEGTLNEVYEEYNVIIPSSDVSKYDPSHTGLREWKLPIPSWVRGKNISFAVLQVVQGGLNYGITKIAFRRKSPISVFVSLDSPEAASFMRIGSPSKATDSKKKRERQLREQLEATKDYTDKKFGENFPGSEYSAPGEEDPTEVEKKAPRLGEFEPDVEDYSFNTWKQETKQEDPKAKTTEKEYEKWKDDKRLKSFAAVRDAQAEKPTAPPVPQTDNKDFETVSKSLTPSGRESEKEKENLTQNVVSAVPGLEAQGVTDLGAALKASAAFDDIELSPEDEEVLDRMEDDWDAADEVNDKIIQDIGNYKVNIAKSILLNKPIYVDPDSIKMSDKMKYINDIPLNAWGSMQLGDGGGIPFVSTPLNYSDENIYVDNDGKVQMNDGSQADYTKGQGYGLPTSKTDAFVKNITGANPLALRGKAQVQMVFPPDGSEPYLRYTDHAYQNRDSKGTDERPDRLTGALSDVVDKLGNLFHRAGNKDADNTDAMAGYSKNIRGDVVTEFDIPLSQLPQEMQDQIASVKKGLGVFNDAGELEGGKQNQKYEGTPEQQEDLYKDLNDLYDTDPDRFGEVLQKAQDNPEFIKIQDEVKELQDILSGRNTNTKYGGIGNEGKPGTVTYVSGNPAADAAYADYEALQAKHKAEEDKRWDAMSSIKMFDVIDGTMEYTPQYEKALTAYNKFQSANMKEAGALYTSMKDIRAGQRGYKDIPSVDETRNRLKAELSQKMEQSTAIFDKSAYDALQEPFEQSDFQASNVGGNYAQQASDQELQDILDRMDNLTGDDLAEYQRLLKLYNKKLKEKTAGAGGSPGQPYTPPKEDPTNPYVPAPGRDTKLASASNRGSNRGKDYDSRTGETKGITTDSDFGKRMRDAVYGSGNIQANIPQQDFGSIAQAYGGQGVDAATLASTAAATQTKKKKKKTTVTASYKPKGSMITEKRKLKSPHDWFNPDDIKPEYPKDPPPEMVNNYHPDLVDSVKKAERFNKLDPASAKAMPKQDDPNIDAKVEKAKNNPDKDGPEWHKKVSDKIRMARAQQR